MAMICKNSCQLSVVSFQLEARGESADFPFCTILKNGLFCGSKTVIFVLKSLILAGKTGKIGSFPRPGKEPICGL